MIPTSRSRVVRIIRTSHRYVRLIDPSPHVWSHGVEEIAMDRTLRSTLIMSATLVMMAAPAIAQEAEQDGASYQLPRGWISSPTPGLLREPSILSKLAMSTDTTIGREPSDGLYAEMGNM